MNYTLQELQRFALNGTLEQHILSTGQLPLQVLQRVLEMSVCAEETLLDQIDELEKALHAERNPPF